ncbi:MAG TPA: SOS response-associated peptidase family protein, partial [Polyangiaceae bacterium]
IWDRWKGVLHGKQERIETCAVITRAPTAEVSAVHDRMPLVIDTKDHEAWLDPTTDIPTLHDILDHRYVQDWIVTPIDTMPDSSRKRQMPLFA